MGWTDERVEILKKLWAEGFSASQIAKQLGGVTRSGVLGKVHRLGLTGRAAPSAPARAVLKAPRAPRPPPAPRLPRITSAPPIVVLAFKEPEDPTNFAPLPVEERAAHFCVWPIGDPASPAFGFCGREQALITIARRDPYCDAHREAERARNKARKPTSPNELMRSLRRVL